MKAWAAIGSVVASWRAGPHDRALDVLFVLVLLATTALRVHDLQGVQFQLRADEGRYVEYAEAVAAKGPGILPAGVRHYLNAANVGQYPPPTRIGYILPGAAWIRVRGEGGPQALAQLSTAAFLATVLILYLFLRRHATTSIALLAATLFAFSPLSTAMARRALQDTFTSLLWVTTLALLYESIAAPARRFLPWLFAASFAWLLVTKETGLLTLVPIGAYLSYRRFCTPVRPPLVRMLVPTTVATGLAGLAYLVLCGGAAGLAQFVRALLLTPLNLDYAVRYNSGPWFRYLIDFMTVSPIVFCLAVGYLVHGVLSRESEPGDGVIAFFSITLVSALAVQTLFIKNLRYALSLDVPLRVLAACALFAAFAKASSALSRAALIALVVVIVGYDMSLYRLFFIDGGIYDPVSRLLLRQLRIIP